MKFNGTNWVNVGNPGFSAGEAYYESLVFGPSGEPYVAYMDSLNSYEATLMKFDGNNWVSVGHPGFSAGNAGWTSLAFGPSGTPYVGYTDGANSWKTTVMKYDTVFVGINEKPGSRLSIYPNPATDNITIELTVPVKESSLVIVDTQGQEFISRQITGPRTQLYISNLPGGVYFVRLTNDGTVEVGKIIKN
jgi:hypothetical protein